MSELDKDLTVVELCQRRFELAVDAEAQRRTEMQDDLRFLHLREQWPGYAVQGRNKPGYERPMLVDNRLMAFRNQVVNEIRMNSPTGRIRPVDSKADVKTAEVFEGIIRHIMSISGGDAAIDTAAEYQVDCGLGYILVEPDWCGDDTWNQDLYLRRIEDPFKWYLDPHSVEVDGSDAQWAIGVIDMTKQDFNDAYPDAEPANYSPTTYTISNGWITKDTVRVAKYLWINKQPFKAVHPVTGEEVTRYRRKCYCSIIAGDQELSRTELLFQGDECYIPLVPVYGLDRWVDNKRRIEGLIRNAKDQQRLLNFAESAEAEHVTLVNKAPWIGTPEQFEGHPEWDSPNVPWAKLTYNPAEHNGTPLPPPARAQPPTPSSAWSMLKDQYVRAIQASMGIYEAALGNNPNDQSGRAVLSIQRQQSQGTFHFSDNLGRSLKHVMRILVLMIPRYYDARDVARIIGEDDGQEYAKLDQEQEQSVVEYRDEQGGIQRIYNLGVGKYDVVYDVGPSYATKRQESAESALALVQKVPQIMGVAGDLIVKQFDWPLSQEIAERLQKAMPPNLVSDDQSQSPEMAQAAQQMQQMATQMEQMSAMIQQLQDERNLKEAELRIKEFDAQTKRLAAFKEQPPDGVGQEIEFMKVHVGLEQAEKRLELDYINAERNYELELMKLGMSHAEADATNEAEEPEEQAEAEQFAELDNPNEAENGS